MSNEMAQNQLFLSRDDVIHQLQQIFQNHDTDVIESVMEDAGVLEGVDSPPYIINTCIDRLVQIKPVKQSQTSGNKTEQLTGVQKHVATELKEIFPDFSEPLITACVKHPDNYKESDTWPVLLQRCIDDLLEGRTSIDDTASNQHESIEGHREAYDEGINQKEVSPQREKHSIRSRTFHADTQCGYRVPLVHFDSDDDSELMTALDVTEHVMPRDTTEIPNTSTEHIMRRETTEKPNTSTEHVMPRDTTEIPNTTTERVMSRETTEIPNASEKQYISPMSLDMSAEKNNNVILTDETFAVDSKNIIAQEVNFEVSKLPDEDKKVWKNRNNKNKCFEADDSINGYSQQGVSSTVLQGNMSQSARKPLYLSSTNISVSSSSLSEQCSSPSNATTQPEVTFSTSRIRDCTNMANTCDAITSKQVATVSSTDQTSAVIPTTKLSSRGFVSFGQDDTMTSDGNKESHNHLSGSNNLIRKVIGFMEIGDVSKLTEDETNEKFEHFKKSFQSYRTKSSTSPDTIERKKFTTNANLPTATTSSSSESSFKEHENEFAVKSKTLEEYDTSENTSQNLKKDDPKYFENCNSSKINSTTKMIDKENDNISFTNIAVNVSSIPKTQVMSSLCKHTEKKFVMADNSADDYRVVKSRSEKQGVGKSKFATKVYTCNVDMEKNGLDMNSANCAFQKKSKEGLETTVETHTGKSKQRNLDSVENKLAVDPLMKDVNFKSSSSKKNKTDWLVYRNERNRRYMLLDFSSDSESDDETQLSQAVDKSDDESLPSISFNKKIHERYIPPSNKLLLGQERKVMQAPGMHRGPAFRLSEEENKLFQATKQRGVNLFPNKLPNSEFIAAGVSLTSESTPLSQSGPYHITNRKPPKSASATIQSEDAEPHPLIKPATMLIESTCKITYSPSCKHVPGVSISFPQTQLPQHDRLRGTRGDRPVPRLYNSSENSRMRKTSESPRLYSDYADRTSLVSNISAGNIGVYPSLSSKEIAKVANNTETATVQNQSTETAKSTDHLETNIVPKANSWKLSPDDDIQVTYYKPAVLLVDSSDDGSIHDLDQDLSTQNAKDEFVIDFEPDEEIVMPKAKNKNTVKPAQDISIVPSADMPKSQRNDARRQEQWDPDIVPKMKTADELKEELIHEVLKLFPEVEPTYLEGLCRNQTGEMALNNVCFYLFDNQYPRVEKQGSTPHTSKEMVEVDFFKHYQRSTMESHKQIDYCNQVYHVLSNDFQWISLTDMRAVGSIYKSSYASTYRALQVVFKQALDKVKKESEEGQAIRLSSLRFDAAIEKDSSSSVMTFQLLKNRRKIKFSMSSLMPELQTEINFVKGKMQELATEEDHQFAVQLNEQEYEDEGQCIECGCCFCETSFDNMVQCLDGHLFCEDCLRQYAKESVFGQGKAKLECMTSGCSSAFPKNQLEKALSSEVLLKYEDRVTEENLNLADIGDLVRCPYCDYAAIMDQGNKVFTCMNEKCKRETCRHCKEDWTEHFGKKCEELEKKDEVKLRLEYEEKMTKAKVRTCYRCKAQFTKEDGCNKMTCRCGAKMCYICRKPISDYKHFCQHPREPGKTCTQCEACSLWTNPEEDDNRAVSEIQKEASKVRKDQGFTEERVIGVPEGPPAKKMRLGTN